MDTINNTTLEKYKSLLSLCMKSKAYYRYTLSGTKNKGKYLRIVTRRGMYFTNEEVKIINAYVFNLAGDKFKMTHNIKGGTLSITLY
jgi:hypothetical protein